MNRPFYKPILVSLESEKKQTTRTLDVDFIGGQGHLTKSEEQAISEFIKAQKLLRAKKQVRKKITTARTNFKD